MKTYKELRNAITIPIKVGDTVLGGKFKNKRITVKDIGKNEKGDITINGRPLLKYRLKPQDEVAPPGWEDTVKAMKKHKEIDNPWALAWYMKNKGYKSHEARNAIRGEDTMKNFKELRGAVKEQEKEKDPIRVAKAKATKDMKIARLKKQIGDIQKKEVGEDAPANSTANVAMRHTMLFKRKKKDVNEALFKAKVKGLDPIYVEKKSAGEVKAALKKSLKNPKDIESVEKISKSEYKKDVLKRFSGKDDEDVKEESITFNEIRNAEGEDTMKTFQEIRNLDEAALTGANFKEAEKLVDYIRNDGKLSRQSDGISNSVRKKFKDLRAMSKSSAKFPKFWMPVVVTAVKEYFNKETRLLAAEMLVDDFIDFEIHQRQ